MTIPINVIFVRVMRTVGVAAIASTLVAASIPPSLSALCPKPKDGEITVCADTDPPRSPYRIPAEIPRHEEYGTRASDSVSRERNALFDYDNGGPGTCSRSGPGGNTGCLYRKHLRNEQQRAGAKDGKGWNYGDPY